MITLHEIGLADRVELMRTNVALMAPPPPVLLPDNPLAKIPTLVLDDGSALFDSRAICEYLDTLHNKGPKLFPADPKERFRQLRWMSFGDGLTDVLLLWRTERLRPDGTQSAAILSGYETKVRASFAQLETEAPEIAAAPFGIGHIALVCTLGQMDFRYGDTGWRKVHPHLVQWYDEMRKRPSVVATEVRDDPMPVPVRELTEPALIFA